MRKPSRTEAMAYEARRAIEVYLRVYAAANPGKPAPTVWWERGWVAIRDKHGHLPGSYRLSQLREMTERLRGRVASS